MGNRDLLTLRADVAKRHIHIRVFALEPGDGERHELGRGKCHICDPEPACLAIGNPAGGLNRLGVFMQ